MKKEVGTVSPLKMVKLESGCQIGLTVRKNSKTFSGVKEERLETPRPACKSKEQAKANLDLVEIDEKKKYQGVYQFHDKWVAKCNVMGKQIHVGYFDTLRKAITERQKLKENPETEVPRLWAKRMAAKTSQQKGVCFNKKAMRWHASLIYNKEPIFLGYFRTEAEAIVARLKAEKDPRKALENRPRRRVAEKPSRDKGVTWHKSMQGWRATIRYSGKTHYLGCYKTLSKAKSIQKKAQQIVEEYPDTDLKQLRESFRPPRKEKKAKQRLAASGLLKLLDGSQTKQTKRRNRSGNTKKTNERKTAPARRSRRLKKRKIEG